MKSKVLSVILITLLLLSTFTLTASAATPVDNETSESVESGCGNSCSSTSGDCSGSCGSSSSCGTCSHEGPCTYDEYGNMTCCDEPNTSNCGSCGSEPISSCCGSEPVETSGCGGSCTSNAISTYSLPFSIEIPEGASNTETEINKRSYSAPLDMLNNEGIMLIAAWQCSCSPAGSGCSDSGCTGPHDDNRSHCACDADLAFICHDNGCSRKCNTKGLPCACTSAASCKSSGGGGGSSSGGGGSSSSDGCEGGCGKSFEGKCRTSCYDRCSGCSGSQCLAPDPCPNDSSCSCYGTNSSCSYDDCGCPSHTHSWSFTGYSQYNSSYHYANYHCYSCGESTSDLETHSYSNYGNAISDGSGGHRVYNDVRALRRGRGANWELTGQKK